jgi:hypothetical protein
MIRWRSISTIEYGHFAEALHLCHELTDVCHARSWQAPRILVPIAGNNNELIVEVEYPDLATYQRETEQVYGDAEFMKLIRGLAEITYPQSSRSELLEDAPSAIA